MTWYYKDGDQEIGPISKEDLQTLINAKDIGRQTLVRRKALDEWVPLAEITRGGSKADNSQPPPTEDLSQAQTIGEPPTAETMSASATSICSQCGRSFHEDQVITYDSNVICAACKPTFVQRLKEGVSFANSLRYAGFWVRCGATIIDWIIIAIPTYMILIPMGLLSTSSLATNPEEVGFSKGMLMMVVQQIISIAIPAFYSTFFIGRYGATLGKMACGLKVVSPEGGKISYLRAFGRYFATLISSIILAIGYLMVAFDSEKRALHDRICSTRVIHK